MTVAAARSARVDDRRLRAILARNANQRSAAGEARAAVLVPLISDPDGVLLTRRAKSLRRHAGQVAFPGGRIDDTDPSIEAAALREAHEEIGLPPLSAEILGRLPDLVTGTGFHVTPVVARIGGSPALTPAPDEVEHIFVLPMSVLRDPAAPSRRSAAFGGMVRDFWVWPHEEEFIWGATAAILIELAAALSAAS